MICTKCSEDKPMDAYRYATGKALLRKYCNKCFNVYRRQHRAKSELCVSCLSRKPLRRKSTCQECLDKVKIWRNNNRPRSREYKNSYNYKLKVEVINAYGGKCVCCKIGVVAFLHMDHINNDGAEHRRKIFGRHGGKIYPYLKKEGFPKYMQILCANCHNAKSLEGCCSYH